MMKSQSAVKQNNAYINIVVSTGCPNSGWENALPVLRELGFDETGDTFDQWNDELFHESGIAEQSKPNGAFQPSQSQTEKAIALLSGEPSTPLLWADDRNLWLLDFWAASFPHVSFLLLYTRAESALAYAFQQGMEPEQFMQTWQTTNQHLINFQRRNRRRSLLLDAETAAQHPQALADACQRIGLELQPINLSEVVTMAAPVIERLLAHQYLRKQSAIQALQVELEVSSQPLGDTEAHQPLQLAELYQGYQKWQSQIKAKSKAWEAQVELSSDYKTQLDAMTQAKVEQERLADVRQTQIEQLTKIQEKQAADQQAQLSQAQQAQKKWVEVTKETNQENELLLLQLHQVQEELEVVFLQKQTIDQAQEKQNTQLGQLRQKLDATEKAVLTAETERNELAGERQKLCTQIEQLTKTNNEQSKRTEEHQGQIRQLSKERDEQEKQVVDSQSQLAQARKVQEKLTAVSKETERENELLLLQLHQVQEELEVVFLQKQTNEQAQENQNTQLKQLRQKLDATEKAILTAEIARKELVGERQKFCTQIELLTKTNNEQSKRIEEHQGQIRQLSKERDEQAKQLVDSQSQLAQAKKVQEKLKVASKETGQKNELLLLQLHQVQEELELYFLKCQVLSKEIEKEQEPVETLGDSDHQKKDSGNPSSSVPQKNISAIRFFTKPFRLTSKEKKREKKQVRLIITADVFDQAWYLAEYPDVAEANIGPIEHYLRFGAAEGRNPSPQFDTVYYLATNLDISVAETNPLVHYVQFGREEGRAPLSSANTHWSK